MENLEHPWDVYAELQAQADKYGTLGHLERAVDEKLNEVLAAIERGDLPNKRAEVDRKLVNLEINRQNKSKRRQQILEDWAYSILARRYEVDEIEVAYEQRSAIDSIRRRVSDREWAVMWALAMGHSYDEVAEEVGASAQGLRKNVSRVRARLRADMNH